MKRRSLASAILSLTACALLSAAFSPVLAADLDAREIIRRFFEAEAEYRRKLIDYTFEERFEKKKFNRADEVISTETEIYDVTPLHGEHYWRVIARDGKPLSPKQEAKQRRKFEKEVAKRAKESPRQRKKRLRKIEKDREELQKMVAEILKVFEFRLVGEERVRGYETWVIAAEPRPDYRPSFWKARFLTKVSGKAWVAKQGYGMVRAEAHSFKISTVGWFLFRINKGATFEMEQELLGGKLWLIDNYRLRFHGRVALIKVLNQEVSGSYRRYDAGSELTSARSLPQQRQEPAVREAARR